MNQRGIEGTQKVKKVNKKQIIQNIYRERTAACLHFFIFFSFTHEHPLILSYHAVSLIARTIIYVTYILLCFRIVTIVKQNNQKYTCNNLPVRREEHEEVFYWNLCFIRMP